MKYRYVGNCTSGLEYEEFQELVAVDPTELQQLVDSSRKISRKTFLSRLDNLSRRVEEGRIPEGFIYGYNPEKDILWSYDENEDIHRFYARR